MKGAGLVVLGVGILLLAPSHAGAQEAPSEETARFFKQNCQSCHTIGGGRLVGPDLKFVTKRRRRAWLINYIPNPKAVFDSGDPYARKILGEAKGQIMPTIPGITAKLAAKLVDLIKAESLLKKSHFAGTLVSDRPLTADDIVLGQKLFMGRIRIKSGAPPCISCHTTQELPGFGGGALGPDLSSAYDRLEGRKALAAWLTAPPSLVMQPVFSKHPLEGEEILGLVAYLKSVAAKGQPDGGGRSLDFLMAGIGGAAFLLLLLDFLWRRRYRAVRRPMISKD